MWLTRERVQGFAIGVLLIAGITMIPAPSALPAEPLTDADSIAAAFGVDIVWDTTFCTSGAHPKKVMGCASAATPDIIYLDPTASAKRSHRTVLHELGHIMQYRLGLERNECEADKFADSLHPPLMGFNC